MREIVASLLAGAVVKMLAPRPGDVLVICGAPRHPAMIREVNRTLKRLGSDAPVAVFLPRDCVVHLEPGRLDSERRS